MTDTWAATRNSINRLKSALSEADSYTRWSFGFWVTGLGLMAIAIIAEFGWPGFLFVLGFVTWSAANQGRAAAVTNGEGNP